MHHSLVNSTSPFSNCCILAFILPEGVMMNNKDMYSPIKLLFYNPAEWLSSSIGGGGGLVACNY